MGRSKKKNSLHKQNNTEQIEINSTEITQKHSESVSTLDFSEANAMKRPHDNDSSDIEPKIKPKKAKKNKKPTVTEESGGKKNKSIRQIKREKHAKRLALEQAVAKDQTKSQCLNYLSQWKHDRQNWKFMKAKQVWLHKNKFSTHLVPDSSWPLLLEYFESAKGNIKNMLLTDANKIITQMDEWTESQNEDNPEIKEKLESTEVVKPDEIIYNRARNLIQCLQE